MWVGICQKVSVKAAVSQPGWKFHQRLQTNWLLITAIHPSYGRRKGAGSVCASLHLIHISKYKGYSCLLQTPAKFQRMSSVLAAVADYGAACLGWVLFGSLKFWKEFSTSISPFMTQLYRVIAAGHVSNVYAYCLVFSLHSSFSHFSWHNEMRSDSEWKKLCAV